MGIGTAWRTASTVKRTVAFLRIQACRPPRQSFRLLSLPMSRRTALWETSNWLPRLDSNQETVIQSHVCYHYTTGQSRIWRKTPAAYYNAPAHVEPDMTGRQDAAAALVR